MKLRLWILAGSSAVIALFATPLVQLWLCFSVLFFAYCARKVAVKGVGKNRPPQWLLLGSVSFLIGLASLGVSGVLLMLCGIGSIGLAIRCALDQEPPGSGGAPPENLSTYRAVAADASLLATWQLLTRLNPPPVSRRMADDIHQALERYRSLGLSQDPSQAHLPPPALEKVHLARRHLPVLGEVEELSFESEYEPFDPEIRTTYLDLVPNRIAQATLLRHEKGPRPTLLCLHGLAGGMPSIDARLFATKRLYVLGFDVVQVMLPFHGRRKLGYFSGQGFLDGHPLVVNAAMGQAIWELRRIHGWLRAGGVPSVGVFGLSLGGYITSLFGSIEKGLSALVPMVPAVRLVPLLRRDIPKRIRRIRDAAGLSDELLEEIFTPHASLGFQPRVAPEGRLIVAGMADRICPPSQADALWEHWGRSSIYWFPGSHLVHRGEKEMRQRLDEHFTKNVLRTETTLPLTRFR